MSFELLVIIKIYLHVMFIETGYILQKAGRQRREILLIFY